MSRSLFGSGLLAPAPGTAPPHAAAPNPWLVVPRRLPAKRTTLLCLHHAGGGASSYRAWVRLLPADVELWMIQLPGREERIAEAPVHGVGTVLDRIVEALQPALRGPYAVFGHSLGATLAYALAVRLQATRALPPPSHLFLSAAPPPRAAKPGAAPAGPESDAALLRRLRSLGGTPEILLRDRDFLDAILPAFRGDSALCAELAEMRGPPLDVPLTILRGLADPVMSADEADAWRPLGTRGVEILTFPGGHFFVQEARDAVVAAVVRTLSGGPARTAGAGG